MFLNFEYDLSQVIHGRDTFEGGNAINDESKESQNFESSSSSSDQITEIDEK